MISKYKLNARVYPSLIMLFPILVLGVYFSVNLQNIYGALGGLGLITILHFILGELGRDRGKKLEQSLWNSWGGTPTTQIMRFSDNTLNRHNKIDYHQKLHAITNIGVADMSQLELNNPEQADEVYGAWCDYLRGQTRDTSKYKLLFQENISYGFRRNLLGLKKPAIIIIIVSLMTLLFSEYLKIGIDYTQLSLPGVLTFFALILILLCWIIIVNKNWIKATAFAYAERLTECTYTI